MDEVRKQVAEQAEITGRGNFMSLRILVLTGIARDGRQCAGR